jgi:hypothetical protein
MSATFLVNIKDRPDTNKLGADGKRHLPGVPNAPLMKSQANTVTKFLGRQGEDGEGPWVYYKEQKKGDRVTFHRHSANRIEFLIEGSIKWIEKGAEPKVYGAGTLSYVEAATIYGYDVLEDSKILIVFDKAPGINTD